MSAKAYNNKTLSMTLRPNETKILDIELKKKISIIT
ncbi:hypothetical protein [Priestia megaterium]